VTRTTLLWLPAVVVALAAAWRALARLRLSRAKHPGLSGHPRIARLLATAVRGHEYGADRFFRCDGASDEVADARHAGYMQLAERLRTMSPGTTAATRELAARLSDLQFTRRYRVPFPFSRLVREHLPVGALVEASDGQQLRNLDGRELYDLSGSYGLNVFGYDFYKACIDAGAARVRGLGPVLGVYHPIANDIVRDLCEISGLDEVSFHMSGTEAVMQAVRLARYHTRRSHVVRFAGAYHGWWDGVQPGIGNPRPARDVYTLREMDERTIAVLRTRRDIACVLVNPIQALHPNQSPPNDGTLVGGTRSAGANREAYAAWLRRLRDACSERGIVLVFDEVFVGFRLARGGAQEYFGVRADMVTYGKTLGGGLPVGVLCGRSSLMRRFREERPSDICFARGTFNAHPYVLGAMHEFLRRLRQPEAHATYADIDATWRARAERLNAGLNAAGAPVRFANLASIWTACYTAPGRYHWMLQFYLHAEGLATSWVGTGRIVFAHTITDAEFDGVADRVVAAARAMKADRWWSGPPTTARGERRRVLVEMVTGRGMTRPAHPAQIGSSDTIGSKVSPRSSANGAPW
jgi:glutamate-1-semialdehyde 2,1-aminomutase